MYKNKIFRLILSFLFAILFCHAAFAASNIALTSAGQSPDAMMVKVVLKKMDVEVDFDSAMDLSLIHILLRSDKGIVAAAHPLAAQAGAEILEKGGNAVDAAIAVSLALGVVEPYASGLGGEGYLVVQMKDGHRFALDFRSTAPKLATYENLEKSGMTLSEAAKTIKGACVPGVPAAIEYVYNCLLYTSRCV